MYISSIHTDIKGNYLYVTVVNGNSSITVNAEDLNSNMKFDNAIICKNGTIRSKNGYRIPREIVRQDKLDLNKYKNLKFYDGTTEKYGITYKGKNYIVKYPKNRTDTSHVSEYVASHFINNLGYKAHNTFLIDTVDGICVLVEDFINTLGVLHTYADTQQSSEGTDIETKAYTYKDIQYMIENHTKIPDYLKPKALYQFWVMFFLDAILGNRDRHKGNWGYIRNNKDEYFVSPVFDNGGSLFPNVLPRIKQYVVDKNTFTRERSEKFPACLICEERDGTIKRTNYYYYINKNSLSSNRIMSRVYKEFRSIGTERIRSAIELAVSNNLIPDVLKSFYVDIVVSRYEHIILRHKL